MGVARGLISKKKIAKPGHIITTAIEHRAVLEPCAALEREGWSVTYVPVTKDGMADLAEFRAALRPDTVLVSVMYANNEVGTIQPIREIAKVLRNWRKEQGNDRLPYFHTDACQAPRFLPLEVEKLGVDLMTINGSKMYGPKGIGCLFVKRNTFLEPILYGGGQERGLRSGTESVPGIIGLATALEMAIELRDKETKRLIPLRDYFIERLSKLLNAHINGHLTERLPNNVNVTFDGIFGELMVLGLDARGIACSTGSACSSHTKDESHVIISLGNTKEYADNTVRFTLARETKKSDIDRALKAIADVIEKNSNIKI
jgi:cysteine desulfurase